MLRLVLILAVMIAAMAFAPVFVGGQGYVSIGIGSYVIETSVYTAIIVILLFYVLLFAIERLLRLIFGILIPEAPPREEGGEEHAAGRARSP